MERIAVVGPGGAGKSTFSDALGRLTGLPVIHLDQYFWHPGWVETPRPEWIERQFELLRGERWIVDGNYSATFDVRFARADTVIAMYPPRTTCVAGVVRRWIRGHGQEIQAAGCPERIDLAFLNWTWRYQKDSRPKLDAALERCQGDLDVVELRSRRDAQNYLDRFDPRP